MNKIDWQAFSDGSLSHEEMIEAKHALRNDPNAKAEWEGFQAMMKEIKAAGRNETVPMDRLSAMLAGVSKPQKRPPLSLRWAATFAAASVLAATYVGFRVFGDSSGVPSITPTAETLNFGDTIRAKDWIQHHTSLDVPTIQLPDEAKPITASYGQTGCWGCIDFVYNGHTFCLMMTSRDSVLDDSKPKKFCDVMYYEGKGVGWKGKNLCFYLGGGTEAERWRLATYIAPQTLKQIL